MVRESEIRFATEAIALSQAVGRLPSEFAWQFRIVACSYIEETLRSMPLWLNLQLDCGMNKKVKSEA